MIEIKNDRVALAAVDARMFQQICDEQFAIALAMATNPKTLVLDVGRLVIQVVLTAIRRVALAAMRLELSRCERAKREFGRGLVLVAHHADRRRRTSGRAPPQPVENAS